MRPTYPKRNTRNEFQPLWYDSECDKMLRKKKKWRKRYKISNNVDDLNKFRQSQRDFKRIMNEKMKLNVEDSGDSAIISKKFWKYVKFKSKSSRIPETIRYGDQFRNLSEDQANLFN